MEMEGLLFCIIAILIPIVIFFIAREFWCWYWKINTIVNKLDEISNKLDMK